MRFIDFISLALSAANVAAQDEFQATLFGQVDYQGKSFDATNINGCISVDDFEGGYSSIQVQGLRCMLYENDLCDTRGCQLEAPQPGVPDLKAADWVNGEEENCEVRLPRSVNCTYIDQ